MRGRRRSSDDDGYASDSVSGRCRFTLEEELRDHFDFSFRLNKFRECVAKEMRTRNIGIGDMFALVDSDSSWSVSPEELVDIGKKLSIGLRSGDAERLVEECGGGEEELTVERFAFWFHDEKRPVLRPSELLALESHLFDRDVRTVIDAWWKLADFDRNGYLQHEEYIDLSMNLQQALNDEQNLQIAQRDWEEDRRLSKDHVDKRKFDLSMLQLAKAWSQQDESIALTLERLLDSVSRYDSKLARRVWRWHNHIQFEEEEEEETKEEEQETVPLPDDVHEIVESDDEPSVDIPSSAPSTPAPEIVEEEEVEDAWEYQTVSVSSSMKTEASSCEGHHTPRNSTPPPCSHRRTPSPPSPHSVELSLMDTLKPHNSQHILNSPRFALPLAYRDSLEAPPEESLPRLVPNPTPHHLAEQVMGSDLDDATRNPVRSEEPAVEKENVLSILPRRRRCSLVFHRDITEPGLSVAYIDGPSSMPASSASLNSNERWRPSQEDIRSILAVVVDQQQQPRFVDWTKQKKTKKNPTLGKVS